MRLFFLLSFSIFLKAAQAQVQVVVSGQVLDEENQPLPGATVKAFSSDSTLVTGGVTDPAGNFNIRLPAQSQFTLLVSYIGTGGKGKRIAVSTRDEDIALKPISLKDLGKTLSEVEVAVLQERGRQRGDTTEFNAGAFKTNPDASAEDLVKKMPGITSDANGIKVNGETVQKVLVDGKPFFGDDPNAALKNLPADLIDKVEVFDKLSDQSAFTGFDDGDQQKTINLVTKKGKTVGQFGRMYAGAGSDENTTARYNAGAALNSFNGDRRATLLLMANNVNLQNFSSSDLAGTSSSGRGGRQSSALMASPQTGIVSTSAAGLNYSDNWGRKISVSGSYFFNNTENLNNAVIERNYFSQNGLTYKQTNADRILNTNHRANLRMEYTIDSANKIIFTPAFSLQDNNAKSDLDGENRFGDLVLLSSTRTRSDIRNLAYDLGGNLLFQHRFRKPRRTISLNLNANQNRRDNEGSYYSLNHYSDTSQTLLDQNFNTAASTHRAGFSLSFTEPIGKWSQLQVNYSPSVSRANSDKSTRDFNEQDQIYDRFNPALSNRYENSYETQRGGITYRFRKEKLSFNLGADAQQASLNGNQTYPSPFILGQQFQNILPNAMFRYKASKTRNLRVYYRSSTNIPSVSQLQNVLDISNPLQVKSGNPLLKQTFENSINFRFGGFDQVSSRNTMLFANVSLADNYISNATYILSRDTLIQGFILKTGSQLSKPVNLSGYYGSRVFGVYGFPVKTLKSNMNVNAGMNYFHSPSLINDQLNYSNSYAANAGLMLGSNISEKIDFSITFNCNYTVVKNTVQKKSDNSFYSQNSGIRFNWIFWKGIVINTDVTHTMYAGLNQDFNQQFLLWNASLGYKFLKNKSLEAKIYVYDILNQNRSISRTVTGAYTEDSYTNVLKRYGMFSLTYTLRKFKSGEPPKTEEKPGLPHGGFNHGHPQGWPGG